MEGERQRESRQLRAVMDSDTLALLRSECKSMRKHAGQRLQRAGCYTTFSGDKKKECPKTGQEVRPSIHPSVCLSFHPYIHMYVFMSMHPSIHSSVHLSIGPSIHPYICMYICTSVRLPNLPSAHSSVRPSICPQFVKM